MHKSLFEVTFTRYFFLLVIITTILVPTIFVLLISYGISSLDDLATFIDAVFKTLGVIVAAAWSLNRYYASRADASQLRVEPNIAYIPAARFPSTTSSPTRYSLLVISLEIINTGQVMIDTFEQTLELYMVVPTQEGVEHIPLLRWPNEGFHKGGPIEPGSWSAINYSASIPFNAQAVKIHLFIQLAKRQSWSWHKTFDITRLS